MRLSSYSSIYSIGHRAIADLFDGEVNVEEKLDGSQFSFGMMVDVAGPLATLLPFSVLCCRSKGAEIHVDAPEKLFTKAVETARRLAPILKPGWVYRGEYLAKSKHNALAYNRAPKDNIILFDVSPSYEAYLPYADKQAEAERLGLECVPLIYQGKVTIEMFREFLNRESVLGGQQIEGVVVKPKDYNLFGLDKKVLMGKFVSEAFKEVHAHEYKTTNPTTGDLVQRLVESYKTPARWAKAVQHLRDAGTLQESPQDIGNLILEVKKDVEKEETEAIKDALFRYAWPHISRGIVGGLPEWYKTEVLVRLQFERDDKKAA